ncbi:MAG: hypothetical protein EXR99_02030 [Gemmataceae bacterium]|nr:hypothetical protein [Gemmataceae bacterium]
MKILLVRHAEAKGVNGITILNDHDRPLTAMGKKQGKRLRKSLKNLDLKVDLVISSPLARAKETAHLAVPAISEKSECHILLDCLSPGGNFPEVSGFLAGRNFTLAALFGHMPDMASLVCYFTGLKEGTIHLDKAGAALLDFPGQVSPGDGRLEWLITPQWKARG